MPTASGIMGQFWTRGVARFNTPPCQGGDRRFESGRVRPSLCSLRLRSG